MKRTFSARAIVPVLILFLIQSGCATAPGGTTPKERSSFGRIGVSHASYLPDAKFAVPAKGRPDGAVKGAAIAFAGILEGGLRVGSGMSGEGAALYLVFLGALATAAAPVGAVVGAIKAMPGREAAASEALAMAILEGLRTQEVLRDEVLRVGTEKTGRPLVPIEGAGPSSADNVATYESMAGQGIDTVLEVALKRISLETDTWGSDPPLSFTMRARCRLVRVPDGTVIDDHEYGIKSAHRKFSEWGLDNAALLGREYEEGYRKLAAAIIDRIFLAGNQADK